MFSKITVEEVYSWIETGYFQIKEDKNLIQRAFTIAGFINAIQNSQDSGQMEIEQELQGHERVENFEQIHGEMEIEVLKDDNLSNESGDDIPYNFEDTDNCFDPIEEEEEKEL